MRHLRSKIATLPLAVALAIALIGVSGVAQAGAEEMDLQDPAGQVDDASHVNKPSPKLWLAES